MLSSLFKKEFKQVAQLAAPLIAALLTQISMELINSLMLGRISAEALAAGGLGIAIFMILIIVATGLFNACGVLIARSLGAKQYANISITLIQSLYLSAIFSIPCGFTLWFSPTLLLIIGEEPNIVALTTAFLHAHIWGIPAFLAFLALREFISAFSFTKIIMILSLIIAPLTAVVNYILIYGKLGFPALGVAGIGYSVSLMEWFLLSGALLFIVKHKTLAPYLSFQHFTMIRWHKIKEILALGTPVAITMGLEVGLFSVTTLMMGHFGTNSLAAHQIALQCATVAFMFPLGISQATAICVGLAEGRGSPEQAKYAGLAGLTLGVIIGVITAIIFLLFTTQIIHSFIDIHQANHVILIKLAVSFLTVAAFFQLFDAIQVIMNGALRGLKDTFIPMCLGLLSYWISGLLTGYYLAFRMNLGGIGLWYGLGIGITVSGILLLLRFFSRLNKTNR